MDEAGCRFVVASGNQYFQLRDFFPGYDERLAFVAENGAFVKDGSELVFAASIDRPTVLRTIDWIDSNHAVSNVLCGLRSAYIQRGTADQRFFDIMGIYYHRLEWVDDLRAVDDQILKFALSVPEERTYEYFADIQATLGGGLEPTTSGHGCIDLIIPGCHKASGLERLASRWSVEPAECAAFGDGGNDVEMLEWAGLAVAVENASDELKAVADRIAPSNADDGVLEVLDELF